MNAPERIRTSDLSVRSRVLYPAELPVHEATPSCQRSPIFIKAFYDYLLMPPQGILEALMDLWFYFLLHPESSEEDALKELFAQAGSVVSAVIIMDKMSGRSKGFGFVEMSSNDEAQKAISMFNEQEFEGRKLTVNEARPMEARPPRTGGNDRGGYGGSAGRREY